MTDLASSTPAKRPEFRNIHVFKDLPGYRLPLAGLVSILHRISGALMFVLLPFIIWMFDVSVSSENSYARFTSTFAIGLSFADGAWHLPAWLMKSVLLALIWAYLHHLIAGLRHLWMDVNHAVSKEFGRGSAAVTLLLSIVLTLVCAAKLFGRY